LKINLEFCALCVVVFVWHVPKELHMAFGTDSCDVLTATDVVFSFI
jgi:hypothetical protein